MFSIPVFVPIIFLPSSFSFSLQSSPSNSISTQPSSHSPPFSSTSNIRFPPVNDTPTESRIKMVQFKWDAVEKVYVVAIWILVAIFNSSKSFTKIFPESSLLIVIGLIIGYFLMISKVDHEQFTLDSHAFFLYLLPPIIFEAGNYPMYTQSECAQSILLFIGGSLLYLSTFTQFSKTFDTFEILLFSSLISAVDPVAVIAVFQEIHVNDFIFVNVFGEALFNDGVTVVLYELFKQFLTIERITYIDVAAGSAAFIVVAVGGLLIGLLFAILVSLLTKYSIHMIVLSPVFIFLVPYLGYLTAEMLSLSPIIAIAVCGMAMKQYVKGNVSTTAANSVKYFTKMLSQMSETAIFMFLGLSTISSQHLWDTAFVVSTIALCIVCRTVGVIVQCLFLNRFRGKKFTTVDQFILSYGGLRGAIAYGLAVSMPLSINAKPMFVTTTIAVIFFTVFLQGSTIRPLVRFLNIETKKERELTMAESVYMKYMDYLVSGVEDIAGQKGYNSLLHEFERFNTKILCPVLMRDHAKTRHFDATKIIRAYAKITLAEAMNTTSLPRRSTSTSSKTSCICSLSTSQDGVHLAACPLSPTNTQLLFNLFSKMLDEKMDKLRKELQGPREEEKDDLCDDYIQQIHSIDNLKTAFKLSHSLESRGDKGDGRGGMERGRHSVKSLSYGGSPSLRHPSYFNSALNSNLQYPM